MEIVFNSDPDATPINTIAGQGIITEYQPDGTIQIGKNQLAPQSNTFQGLSYGQAPIVHEVGHMPGLQHPGQKINPPNPDPRNQGVK